MVTWGVISSQCRRWRDERWYGLLISGGWKFFFFFLKNNYNKLLTRSSNHFPPKLLQAFCTWRVVNSVTRLNVSSTCQDLQTYLTLTADLAVEVLGYIEEDDIVKISKPCLFFFFFSFFFGVSSVLLMLLVFSTSHNFSSFIQIGHTVLATQSEPAQQERSKENL